MSVRILLTDDWPKIRFALPALLRQLSGLSVLGKAANAVQLLALAKEPILASCCSAGACGCPGA
jgi:DNA-binding NarL/FixJ family response regulator